VAASKGLDNLILQPLEPFRRPRVVVLQDARAGRMGLEPYGSVIPPKGFGANVN